MVATTNEFNTLEKDLLPLLDHISEKKSFYIDENDKLLTSLPQIHRLRTQVQ